MTAGLAHNWPKIRLPEGDTHFEGGHSGYHLERYLCAVGMTRKQRLAIDIGAHCGFVSRYMMYDFERVVSFEADPECARLLRKNLPVRKLTVYNEIVSSSKHSAKMVNDREGNSGARHMKRGGDRTAITIDEFGYTDVDLIKIDVQGAELDVLEGAKETIKRCKPVIWYEAEPDSPVHKWMKHRKARLAARMGSDYIVGWNEYCQHAAGPW